MQEKVQDRSEGERGGEKGEEGERKKNKKKTLCSGEQI